MAIIDVSGGTRELQAEVRIVAATNRNLEQEMEQGSFREDLYYRLNVVTISLPSLRERKEDIPELVEHFLKSRAVGGIHFQIGSEVMENLIQHDWPGNIRELANVLERAQILAEDNYITLDDLPDYLLDIHSSAPLSEEEDSPTFLREIERRHIISILEQEKGNKVQTAKVLGVSRRSLYRLLSKHRLEKLYRETPPHRQRIRVNNNWHSICIGLMKKESLFCRSDHESR